MARSPEDWWPNEEARAAATIPARWDDVVELDGLLIPRAFEPHYGMTFDASIVETDGPHGPVSGSVAGWFRCDCGWQSAPPAFGDPRGEPVWTAEGWMAYYRHLPRGFYAHREALRSWFESRPRAHGPMPRGWALGDGPDDNRFRWWLWQVDVGLRDLVVTRA
jgi:hypothetical protein